MKKILLAISLSALTLTSFSVLSKESTEKSKQNLQITRQYYANLIVGSQPQLAELTMLMTMLPKGGDIHHHYSGSIYAETYLDWVGQQGFCIYRESNEEKKQEKFRVETKPLVVDGVGVSCMKADAVRKDASFIVN